MYKENENKVAIYHANTKTISRGKGHSSTAKSAYISAEKVTDYKTGEVFDYSRKKGVMESGVVLPNGIDLQISREELWNKAEAAERRKDGRVGREWEISLPHELSDEQKVALAKELTQKIADRYGVACEYAVHIPSREGSDERNYHVHILSTTRKIDNDGNLGNKSDIELENKALLKEGKKVSQEQIKDVREEVANVINKHLERAQVNEKISHKSLEEQGIQREPTTHKGKAQVEVERRLETELVKVEVQVTHDGAELAKLNAELELISKLKEKEAQRIKALANESKAEGNFISGKGELLTNENNTNEPLKKYNNELFNIAREHKEFFTKQTAGDYSYYANRDASVEVHSKQIKIHRASEANIRLSLDIAVSKFGNEFEIQGSKTFINDSIKEIASNEKYRDVSLANKEHQKMLESKRHELQQENSKVENPAIEVDLMARVREHLAKQNEPIATQEQEQKKIEISELKKEIQELSPIERAKQHLASLKEQPKSARELAQEFEQKAQAEKIQQEQLKKTLEKSRSQGRGFSR
jgi:hypothetical protein